MASQLRWTSKSVLWYPGMSKSLSTASAANSAAVELRIASIRALAQDDTAAPPREQQTRTLEPVPEVDSLLRYSDPPPPSSHLAGARARPRVAAAGALSPRSPGTHYDYDGPRCGATSRANGALFPEEALS